MRILACGVFVVFASIVGVCWAAPEPAVVPAAKDWTLDVTFEHPRQISVTLPGEKRPKRFWYIILTLTNKTNNEVGFYPKCDLMTDTFQIVQAGKSTKGVVFERIKRRHQSRYPFLESIEFVDNRILQGRDNTKDVAIIWPDFDAGAKNIKIFIAGLSNETVAVEHPRAKDPKGQAVKLRLRKTLELNYAIPGGRARRAKVKPAFTGKRWVMR